jgi:hypothetical protein
MTDQQSKPKSLAEIVGEMRSHLAAASAALDLVDREARRNQSHTLHIADQRTAAEVRAHELEIENTRLRKTLLAFTTAGVRADLMPSLAGQDVRGIIEFYNQYLLDIDTNVRLRASRALDPSPRFEPVVEGATV